MNAINVDQVVQLIETLYNSKDTNQKNEANKRLMELVSHESAWDICWPLLDLNRFSSHAVHFFGAHTLCLKINSSWNTKDQEWLEKFLRPKILETLVAHASSANAGKNVIERLSLALASYALHSIPTFWPEAIEDILKTLTPQNLSVPIAPSIICDILLRILIYIPEEYAVLVPQQSHRAKLNGQITKSGPIVFKFLHSLLVAGDNMVTSDNRQSILKCLTSWTLHSQTSLLEMDGGKPLLELLYNLMIDEDLCSQACTSLAATFTNQKADSFRNTIIDFIPKLAQLKPIIDKHICEDNIECAIKVYSLISHFSENHSRLYLKIILNDGIELDGSKSEIVKQSIFGILKILLDCTSAAGMYGTDEKYSDITLTFWQTFFENFCYYMDSFSDVICKTFDPLVDSLLRILINKARYPSSTTYYQVWNDEQRETYRCYRQDIGDTISLIMQFPRARDRILTFLHDQLAQELNLMSQLNVDNGGMNWQGFESIMFAVKSISESVPFDEADYVPKIFNLISQVPYSESHALLYCTVAEMISGYSDWLYTHQAHLATAFNVLFMGINSPNSYVRLMSTLSLKDLTSDCQTVLHQYAEQIVRSCTSAVLQQNQILTTREKSRLMHAIGTTLALSSASFVTNALDNLTSPLIQDLSTKVQLDPTLDITCRADILDKLSMLGSLLESMYVKKYYGNDYETEGDENVPHVSDSGRFDTLEDNTDIVQPSLDLLRKILPIFSVISTKYRNDEDIIALISNTIERATKSLGIEIKPVLNEFFMIIVSAYDPLTNASILDGSRSLYMLFRTDQSVHPLLREAFTQISDKTLEVCLKTPLREISTTIEGYFKYATIVCKKFPDFLTNQQNTLNIQYIYKLAIASLELPEKRTLAEVCNFLCWFRQRCVGEDHLHQILISNLDLMLSNIFNVLGGNYSTPRNGLDHVIDLLFALIDLNEASEPLKAVVEKDEFPTAYVDRDQKARFVSKILHEKNRRKFKEACNAFVLQVRNLNRS